MNEPIRKKHAKERYPEHFKISKMVINRLVKWLHRTDISAPQTALGIVKFASVIRAFNLYKSINILLEKDHWENAYILARSMFELLLNLEEVIRDEQDAEEKAKRFLRHQHLSKLMHYINDKRYEIKTGRVTKEEEIKIAETEKNARIIFGEFIDKRKDSEWNSSWCGKSVRRLAKDSGKPIRLAQYEILYSYFSEFSHSNPLATMTTVGLGDTPEETERLIQNKEEVEKTSMIRVLTLTTTWLLEILFIGKSEIPTYEIKWNFDVLKKLYSFYGVEPPKLPWEEKDD